MFRTPFWSVTTAIGTIVTLIVVFIAAFPGEGGITSLNLGLTVLTGFATFNLLLPLAIGNGALIYHRRLFPNIERGFRVPGVPAIPVLGIVSNLGLIYNLPRRGVVTGIGLTTLLLGVYLAWGGEREIDELVHRVRPPKPALEETDEAEEPAEADGEYFRVLVPVSRPENAPAYVRLAELFAFGYDRPPLIEVITVTEVPDQTPHEVMEETARDRADAIEEALAEEELSVEYTVEAHTCRDVAFDILQSAREDDVDLILMGYPEKNDEITKNVEYKAPCDVVFATGLDETRFDRINIGAGGGPHHHAAATAVRHLGEQGLDVNIITVDPAGTETAEDPASTVSDLNGVPNLHLYSISAASIAEGLVSKSKEEGGLLVIGASRDRRLRQWVFGSTPDSVVERARLAEVPVLIYASSTSLPRQLEDYLFSVYRYLLKRRGRTDNKPERRSVETKSNQ